MTRPLIALLLGSLVVRLGLIGVPGYLPDEQDFTHWALFLAAHGPLTIYDSGVMPPVDYPPGYLYVLWAIGSLNAALGFGDVAWRVLLRALPIAADLVVIWESWVLARRVTTESRSLAVATLVALAPPLWIDSAFWGQADSVPLAFALGATIAVLNGRLALGLPLIAIAILIKPQSVVIAPALALLTPRTAAGLRGLAGGVAGSLVVAYLVALPFTEERLPIGVFRFLIGTYVHGVGKAPLTTAGAFNLYALIAEFYTPDSAHVGPIAFRTLGVVLVLAAVTAATAVFGIAIERGATEPRRTALLLGATSLAYLALFLFATRVHERYLLPAIVFGAPLAMLDGRSAAALGWLAIAFTINCLFILVGFHGGEHHPLGTWIGRGVALGSIASFALLWQTQQRRLVATL